MIENEKKSQKEIDDLKSERDRRLNEYHGSMDKDREVFKQKLQELEQKVKDAENKKTSLIFEQEKERSQWSMERDHLNQAKNNA